MKAKALSKTIVLSGLTFVGVLLVYGWTPLPIKQDRRVFMPGSQQGAVNLESATRCDNCHGGYNKAVEPAHNWRGGMMANAARDPLWAACLTVALQDSIWALGNPNAGDLCIRCHSPAGWLGGRSDPPNLTALAGSDFEGISCDACHKMTDAFRGLRQLDDLPPETNATAIAEANKTYLQDLNVLSPLTLFDGTPFFNRTTDLPTYFGDGVWPKYVEATSGQYFVDPTNPKRGPRWDADPKHQWYYSRFHKTKYMCATCHDVSNPVLGRLLSGDMGLPEKQAAASFVHVERTFSEFMLSAYGQPGGAPANPKINLPAGTLVNKCQDCHMRDVTGTAANKAGLKTRTDLALHDQTGGNTWISGILASADQSNPALYDPYNYAILSGAKYPGARVDVAGVQGHGAALKDGQARALQQLQMAADLVLVADTASAITLRIVNNTGHKLISGFPEGRRMWLNVKFYDAANALVGEINPYSPLVVTTDAQGNKQYVAGGILHKTREDLVYEAEMASALTGEAKTFHFVLGTDRYKDNRIPPKGFDITRAAARLAQPKWAGADAPNYFTAAEYAGGYDEVTVPKPAGAVRWEAALYYQTTSKEYIEFLRDQINGTANTLSSPTPSGEPRAYIAQTDPFFATLKDWGRAIWDLWLHNGGSPPVLMASLGAAPPCTAPAAPSGLTATAGKRRVTLSWNAVSGATAYRVYYAQGGKYTLRATVTGTTYTDSNLTAGSTYCYAVTAHRDCGGGSTAESPYSATVCAVPTR
ncbi:MAG: fibronectin type III domain-containing protein [Verrucomicrobiae bacterium]|nr:fibronectin type III domain-containing protein [Verrucomicrobiae bacterium]